MQPLTNAERRALREQIRAAFALLPRLSDYRAEVHKPCDVCGCVLFAPVAGGYRCLWCWPPLEMPQTLRCEIAALAVKKAESDA